MRWRWRLIPFPTRARPSRRSAAPELAVSLPALFRYYWRRQGLGVFINAIKWRLDADHAYADDGFDERFGTETADALTPEEAGLVGPRAESAILYCPTSEADVTAMLADLAWPEDRVRAATFVDLGCGKGRAALVASRSPFAEVVGIELSARLHAVAEANLAIWADRHGADPRVRFVHGDAAAYEWPAGPLVVYLFHPFDAPVLDEVLTRLAAAIDADPRPVALIYRRPWSARRYEPAMLTLGGRFSVTHERVWPTRFYETGWEIWELKSPR
jgi:SAM-dependent methyltransferase